MNPITRIDIYLSQLVESGGVGGGLNGLAIQSNLLIAVAEK